jgi:hypothetical protein
MAKELMEIGGFITEGAEIVNHDNSLSGNGTVDSPLRLNETVLFSSDSGVQNNITLTEDVENFEFVRVEWCPYTEDNQNWTTPYDVVTSKVKYNTIHLTGIGISVNGSYQIITNLILNAVNRSMTVAICGTVTISPTAASTSSLTGYKIYKIVGINRKA